VELAKALDQRKGCLSTHTLGRRRMLILSRPSPVMILRRWPLKSNSISKLPLS
jgi:hypothetical protein